MNGIECAFAGRLGGDPEPRTSQAGKPWCRFSVAIGHGDDVQWVNVSCFGELAEKVCETLGRGHRVYVEGAVRLNSWTDRDGRERYGLQCSAHYVDKHAPRAHKPKRAPADARPAQRSLDDAIPF